MQESASKLRYYPGIFVEVLKNDTKMSEYPISRLKLNLRLYKYEKKKELFP
jgi:hypothetical protein